ncbi:uncharacterized protein [Cherax quadricarinatus]|uniref:uncharacterized protein n=1 Tax=Cherax quadricarinatus TaxID=27406 RepID=UPI002379D71B|nr:uncharacterized protein LOC128686788 [Cherax quadricarinatus]
MATVGFLQMLTLLLLLLLTLLTQAVLSKPRRRHHHGECLLQQAQREVKHLRDYCEGNPEAHRVFSGIPVFSLCKDDFSAIEDFSLEPQETMKKCCRNPDLTECSDKEWRDVLLARYIRVLCDLTHCDNSPPIS